MGRKPSTKVKVTPKVEKFCQAWVDFGGNAQKAALEAFDVDNEKLREIPPHELTDEQATTLRAAEKTASVMSGKYMRKMNTLERIDQILEERGLTDQIIKQEHFKVIKQDGDLKTKQRGIADYYRMMGKFNDKLDLTSGGKELKNLTLSDEEKARIKRTLVKTRGNNRRSS